MISENLNTVPKKETVWGEWYNLFSDNIDSCTYRIKKLHIKPQKFISMQYHENRDEVWTIIKGKCLLALQSQESDSISITAEYHDNDTIFIPKLTIHQAYNPTNEELIILELQSGIVDEYDIYRKSYDLAESLATFYK